MLFAKTKFPGQMKKNDLILEIMASQSIIGPPIIFYLYLQNTRLQDWSGILGWIYFLLHICGVWNCKEVLTRDRKAGIKDSFIEDVES